MKGDWALSTRCYSPPFPTCAVPSQSCSKPSLLHPCPAEGHREASWAPCSWEGQGQWFTPAPIMERDFGGGRKQTLCIPWDISVVADEGEEEHFCQWVMMINLVAALCLCSRFVVRTSCRSAPRVALWGHWPQQRVTSQGTATASRKVVQRRFSRAIGWRKSS